MLLGLVSDPHANLPALEAVLADVDRVAPDTLVCLGDFIGYGAQPNEVVDALKERAVLSLVGNHDLAGLGAIDISAFNPHAAAAARWTHDNLSDESRRFLEGLSSTGSIEEIKFAHASMRDPVWEYVMDAGIAGANFSESVFEVGVVGHTHIPAVYVLKGAQVEGHRVIAPKDGIELVELPEGRLLLNPGGVGQPRDGDPRASWATWDTESREFILRRLDYPIDTAQRAILAAGLPGVLAERLSRGW